MEFEFWWLSVIPLFFGLGWAASRLEMRQQIRASAQLPAAYFKGLNLLLNEQPDKAIDAFVDVVKLDPETVELHFALGNLFRRRGETDRAIRVHQSLLARSDLQSAQREHALFELGQDYLRAGLLDRAEDAFNRLEGSGYSGAALRHRLDIAQMVRDWPRAVDLAERLQRESGADQRPLIAHFRCELAQQSLAGDGVTAEGAARARRELDRALEAAPAHPRPWLLRGEAAFSAEAWEDAIAAWNELARISPAHLALSAEHWLQAHERVGRADAALARLEATQSEHPAIDALRAIAQGRARRDGPAAATAWLRAALERSPSLLGLQQLLALQRACGAEPAVSADAALTESLIERQATRLARFVCGHCGFKARSFHWQCPGCHHWDSYPPRRTDALDSEA